MIIWINGAFGVGKTTVSRHVARMMGARLFDPERVGFVVQRIWRGHDYQDVGAWRHWTRRIAATLDAVSRCVVTPMTVVEPVPFRETIGALRTDGHIVRHFTLVASRETIRSRLLERRSGDHWAVAQLDRCLARLGAPEFAEWIDTEALSAESVAERIVASVRAPSRLNPPSR